MNEKYYIKLNLESGNGLPDLVLKPKNKLEKRLLLNLNIQKLKRDWKVP